MLKKFTIAMMMVMFLATFVSYSFAECNTAKQAKDQKVSSCQCCCCGCCKSSS